MIAGHTVIQMRLRNIVATVLRRRDDVTTRGSQRRDLLNIGDEGFEQVKHSLALGVLP